jgi:hypothetical protein
MKIVTLMNDISPENPCDDSEGWKLYSFGRRHSNHRDPESFFPNGKPSIGLRRKLAVGTAFLLSYFEHGNSVWSLQGDGPKDQWDSVHMAGLLVWEGKAKDLGPPEKREEYAEAFLEVYTCWCNGEVYGYSVEDVKTLPCGHKDEPTDVDSCFGFYGNDLEHMAEEVRAAVDGDPEVEIRGEASDLAGFRDFGQEKRKVA